MRIYKTASGDDINVSSYFRNDNKCPTTAFDLAIRNHIPLVSIVFSRLCPCHGRRHAKLEMDLCQIRRHSSRFSRQHRLNRPPVSELGAPTTARSAHAPSFHVVPRSPVSSPCSRPRGLTNEHERMIERYILSCWIPTLPNRTHHKLVKSHWDDRSQSHCFRYKVRGWYDSSLTCVHA